MSHLLKLEEFERDLTFGAARQIAQMAPEELEARVKSAYEQGYAAGWDDAIEEEKSANERIGAEFARSLRDLGFTFHEARNHVLSAMEEFLGQVGNSLMPQLVLDNLGPFFVQEIMTMASEEADCEFEILVAPGTLALIEPYMGEISTFKISPREDTSLVSG